MAAGEEEDVDGREGGPKSGLPPSERYVAFGPFCYARSDRLLFREGRLVTLPLRVNAVLDYLLHHADEVASKEELIEEVWGNAVISEDSLSKTVSLLRSALDDDPHDPVYIQTVPRRGYRFVAPLSVVETRETAEVPASAPAWWRLRKRWAWTIIWSLAILAALAAGFRLGRREVTRVTAPVSSFALPLGTKISFDRQPAVAVSPDGSKVIVASSDGEGNRLYLREVDRLVITPLQGTDGAKHPFFSPDGGWVGFFASEELKKISLETQEVISVAAAPVAYGGSWGPDDNIVFASALAPGLLQVSAHGGEPRTLFPRPSSATASARVRFPQVVDDGRAVLFSIETSGVPNDWSVAVAKTATGEVSTLIHGSRFARYSASGHLLYARQGSLFSVGLDLDRLDYIQHNVAVRHGLLTWAEGPIQSFGLSSNGLLAYITGSMESEDSELVWVDRSGTVTPLGLPVLDYAHPRLSPDGRRLAVTVGGDVAGIWLSDLERLTLMPLDPGASGILPVWVGGSERIAFTSQTEGGWEIVARSVNNDGPRELMVERSPGQAMTSSTAEGGALAYVAASLETGFDVWVIDNVNGGTPRSFLASPANERAPTFSLDGRLLAYVSDEAGVPQVFVVTHPRSEWKQMVSTDGGTQPAWDPAGSILYYRQEDRLMEVDVALDTNLRVSAPRTVLRFPASRGPWPQVADYDIDPSSGRILMLRPVNPRAGPDSVNLVVETGFGWLSGASPRGS